MIIRKRRQIRAYFNNVPFFMETNESTGGHRIVKHEFPLQDNIYTEDLGLKGKEYLVLGFLAGQNYKDNKQKLVEQLEKRDEIGTLNHPYLGTLKVRCLSFRVVEINIEQGFIRVQMHFLDAGISYVQIEKKKESTLFGSVQSALESSYKYMADSLTSAEDSFQRYSDALNAYTENIEDKLAPFIRLRENVQDFQVAIFQTKEALKGITSEPGKLWETTLNIFKAPEKLVTPDVFISIILSRLPGAPILSQEAAKAAIAARTLKDGTIKSTEKSSEKVTSAIDRVLNLSPTAEIFNSMQALKSDILQLTSELEESKNIKKFKTSTFSNSLLLSYHIYGSIEKEREIREKNSAVFFKPNQEIEYSNG